jgi:hypothetical protein
MPEQTPQLAPGVPLELPAFGAIEPERVLAHDDLIAVVRDKYPVATGHMLIVPRRAVNRFQDLSMAEKTRLMAWVDWVQQHLQATLAPARLSTHKILRKRAEGPSLTPMLWTADGAPYSRNGGEITVKTIAERHSCSRQLCSGWPPA